MGGRGVVDRAVIEATPTLPRMRGSAAFSVCRRYRYSLVRVWKAQAPRLCFCMLNPSTADAFQLDPSVRRCVGFALERGFGSLEVINIFAFRSTDPAGLRTIDDPVGPGNDRAIRAAARRADALVVAWGTHGALLGRGAQVRKALAETAGAPTIACVGVTGSGHPRHPLYIRADTPFTPFG